MPSYEKVCAVYATESFKTHYLSVHEMHSEFFLFTDHCVAALDVSITKSHDLKFRHAFHQTNSEHRTWNLEKTTPTHKACHSMAATEILGA